MVNVFISYSHDSDAHRDKVLALSNQLIQEGVDCYLDQYVVNPAEGWQKEMDTHITKADFVLLICTETYLKRVNGDETKGKGLGVKWESQLIYQHIYNNDSINSKFIPVVFSKADAEFIPTPLKGVSYYCLDCPEGYLKLYRRLTAQPEIIKPEMGPIIKLETKKVPPLFPPNTISPSPLKIHTAHLPVSGSLFLGRDKELAILDEAWHNHRTHMVILTAWGGAGKTALVNHWLAHMATAQFKGATRVYAWSFYSQGAAEGKQASADKFIDDTLRWFGERPQGTATEKSRRLAEVLRQEKTLFILDGLEPQQYPPNQGHGLEGRIKDPGLTVLLKDLALGMSGLCIITSRHPVTTLAQHEGQTVRSIPLDSLSNEAGVALLRQLGNTGSAAELSQAVTEYEGHALALTLLGQYLATRYKGDIRQRDCMPALTASRQQGDHARRVMAAYETWLGPSPELDILSILGLFEQPVEPGALGVLKAKPVIPGVTEHLVNLSEEDWCYALKHVRDLSLLGKENPDKPDTLDCHPLVREYFGQQLAAREPKGWKKAHLRLYDYYRNLPKKDLPETLEEMEPLFAAITHGCAAGKHQEALDEVYDKRIKRGGETNYCCKQLGAFGADLAALSHFFTTPWSQPAAGLRDSDKAWVVNNAAFRLRALGRLLEAQDPMLAGLDMVVQREDWRNAAQAAGNLSELNLTLGQVPAAVEYGRQAVEYADRSKYGSIKEGMRTTHADALLQAGDRVPAEKLFLEAENLQKKRRPEYIYLYSLQGYRFCDLLLAQGKHLEVKKRAEQTLKDGISFYSLLSNALDHLSLGRAGLLAAQENKKQETWSQALAELNQGVEGLRKAGQQDDLPRGLLTRALYYRLTQQYQKAWTDLAEALEIAELGSMKLFIADYHLQACPLALAQGNPEAAATHLAEAERRVIEMGYGRRKEEIAQLKNELRIENG